MQQFNIFDEPLDECCANPITGFYRDGFCHTDELDRGIHVVCAEMSEEFLNFSKSRGNDLSTPRAEYNFPGLKPEIIGVFAQKDGKKHMIVAKL